MSDEERKRMIREALQGAKDRPTPTSALVPSSAPDRGKAYVYSLGGVTVRSMVPLSL